MVQDTSSVIIVRQATLADLEIKEDIQKIINGAYRSKGGWTDESALVNGQRATLEDMETHIKDTVNVLFLAFEKKAGEDQMTVVGTVQIQPDGPDEAEIGLLSVDQSLQSRGIGGRLVRTAMDEMKIRGYKRAVIHVLDVRTEILAWYRKLGFVETGERTPFVWPELLKVKSLEFLVLKKSLI
ncbi:acyl-CoA N-acyltransferase [Halteromyces radiatus]|uniref:acyl-CoA N-acyltransferase n=1 Tax=Halteromyces radiatus TaxID=101107 RepID=UPI00221EA281|nr:acyl-CoA N-acyltransferase [Halteromyces radiatus]KAI8085085.1 acyl-CoA N-acyltransferase [Halteromyces radiatus]